MDSIADWVFYIVMCIKYFNPLVNVLPVIFWVLFGLAVVVRAVTYGFVYIKFKKFDSIHTYGSKLTGALTFLTPYYFLLNIPVIGMMVTVIVGLLASVEQMLIHFMYKDYDESVKSLLLLKKKNKETEQTKQ